MNPLIFVALAALGFVALTSKKAPAAPGGGAQPIGGMRFRVEMSWPTLSMGAPKPGDAVVANLYGNAGTPVSAGGTETFLGPVKVVLQKRIQAGDATKAELWDAQVAEDHAGTAEWPAKGRVLTLRILGLSPGTGGTVEAARGTSPGGSTVPVGGARDLLPPTTSPSALRRTSPFGSAVSSIPGTFGGGAGAPVAGTLADLPDEVEAAVATVFETADVELDPTAVDSLADTLDATGKLAGLSDAAKISLSRFATLLRQKAVRVREALDKAAKEAAAAAIVGPRGLDLLPFLAELPTTIQSAVVPIFNQVSGGGDLRNLSPADALLLKPGVGLIPVPGEILPSAEDLTATAAATRMLTKGTSAEAAGEAAAYLLEVLATDPSVPKVLFVTAAGG